MCAIQNAVFELLAYNDFFLFTKLKGYFQATKYKDDYEVMTLVNSWFEEQREEFFSRGIKA